MSTGQKTAFIILCCIIGLAFAIGQILLYVFFFTNHTEYLFISLYTSIARNINIRAFFAVMTVIGAGAGALICYAVYYHIKNYNYAYVALLTILYSVSIVTMAPFTAGISLVFGFIFLFTKARTYKFKNVIVTYAVLMMLSCVVFPLFSAIYVNYEPADIEYDGVTYGRGEDGKYYATDYDGDADLLKIPAVLDGKYEVGGISDNFMEEENYYLFNLNYEHATDMRDTLQVVAFTLKTSETMPVPKREGYSFYGWWSTNNRNTGKQLIDNKGKITANKVNERQELYAMWYGSDYKFISSVKEFDVSYTGKYVLTEDLVMPDPFIPVGGLSGMENQSSRVGFGGTFDGNYHTITYSITGSRRYSGLFSWNGSNGVIKNLGVDVNIYVKFLPQNDEYAFAGGIAAINDGIIRNCWCTGSIYVASKYYVAFAGGIAGASGTNNVRTGAITSCYNLADIETVADDAYAGGILGSAENNGHVVSYCYNRGTIKATGANSKNTAAGGIISHGRTYAEHCFNAGAIKTNYKDKQSIGGIIGFTRKTTYHCYFPVDCVWLQAGGCEATWGIGTYPDDSSGGTNTGVTVIKNESAEALKILNGDTKEFVLKDGKIQLYWELL